MPLTHSNDNDEEVGEYYDDVEYDFAGKLIEDIEQDSPVDIQLADLNVGDFVIALIPRAKKNVFSEFVYKIVELNNGEIYGDWYEQNPDHLKVFKKTNEEETLLDLKQIIMKLPEPRESRGRYIFEGYIMLKTNVKYNI